MSQNNCLENSECEEITITDVETHIVACPTRPWIFVEVHTNAGISGIGEAMAHRKPETVKSAIQEMGERYLIGESPFNTERIHFQMYRNEWFAKNVVNSTVISAVDIACWDIKGKVLGKPVYELLGGLVEGSRIRAYANGWFTNSFRDPEEMGKRAKEVVDQGYDALKFDPFGSSWERMTRAEMNASLEKIRAIRDHVGPDIDLLIEGHGRFTPGVAVEVAREMEEFNPTWFEEPTPADNIDALDKVSKKSSVPVASGERAMTKFGARDLFQHTEIDIIQTDVTNAGGITESKKIAAMAEANHVSFSPHNSQGPVATAVCIQIGATCPNYMIQEAFEEFDVPWKTDLLEEPLEITNGEIIIPDKPGIGVELDHDVVEKHNWEDHKDRVDMVNPFKDGWESRSLD